jgi:hypothetical protein
VHAFFTCVASECMCFVAHADDVPLLGVLRTSAVIGASTCSGGYRCPQDGPTETFFPITSREGRHLSEDRDVFPRHDIQRNRFAARRLLSPASVPALSLTPPTLCPHGWGQVFLIGHCKCHGTITRFPRLFESADTFFTRWDSTPGTDDPSVPPSSIDSAVDKDSLPCSH